MLVFFLLSLAHVDGSILDQHNQGGVSTCAPDGEAHAVTLPINAAPLVGVASASTSGETLVVYTGEQFLIRWNRTYTTDFWYSYIVACRPSA